MITITLNFEDAKAVDATLLAALGELPAKLSFILIQQVHQQVAAQIIAQAADPQPGPPVPAEAAPAIN